MNCYRKDCQHETHHCCQECGAPVCKEHRKIINTFSSFLDPDHELGPMTVLIPNAEIVCDRCLNRLQEHGQVFSEMPGI